MIFFADIEPLLILENFQELSSSNSSLSFGNVLTTLKGGEFSHLFETYLNNHFKKVNQSMRLNSQRVKGLYNVAIYLMVEDILGGKHYRCKETKLEHK